MNRWKQHGLDQDKPMTQRGHHLIPHHRNQPAMEVRQRPIQVKVHFLLLNSKTEGKQRLNGKQSADILSINLPYSVNNSTSIEFTLVKNRRPLNNWALSCCQPRKVSVHCTKVNFDHYAFCFILALQFSDSPLQK